MDDIRAKIHAAVEILPTERAVSEREAERRAGQFLLIQAHITDKMDELNHEKIGTTSILAAIYPKLMAMETSKQVTEKKVNVEGHEDYLAAREAVETIEAQLNYLKTYFKIFENAHIFYRQLAKAEFNG